MFLHGFQGFLGKISSNKRDVGRFVRAITLSNEGILQKLRDAKGYAV